MAEGRRRRHHELGCPLIACVVVAVFVGAAAPDLVVRTEPEHVVLDKVPPGVQVWIEAPGKKLERVRLFSNVGSVGQPTPVGRAQSRAVYVVPPEFHPQVALFAASADVDGVATWAFAALPLWGKGVVSVKATPGAPVKLVLAGKTYGPVKADRGGVAKVPVEVPPGENSARAGKTDVPVGVLPFLQTLVVADQPRLAPDATTAALRIFAVDGKGAPLDDAGALQVSADVGELSPLTQVAPGSFTATLTLPPSGEVPTIKASVVGNALAHSLALRRGSGPPARIEISFSEARHVAGSGDGAVTVRAVDRFGVPTSAFDLEASVTGAVLGERALDDGTLTAPLKIGDVLPASRAVVVVARAGGLTQTAELPLAPAAAATLELTAPPEGVTADGAERALGLRAVDRFGNDVDAVTVTAKLGATQAPRLDEQQRRVVPYTPPLLYETSDDVVTVTSGDVSSELKLPLRAGPRRFFVGVAGGAVSNFAALTAPALIVEAGWRFAGSGVPVVEDSSAGVEVAPLYRGLDQDTGAGAAHADLVVVAVGPVLRTHIPLVEGVSVYGSAAGHVVVVDSVVAVAGLRDEARFLALGGALAVGGAYRLGPGAIHVETRAFGILNEAEGAIDGSLWGLGVFAGYRAELF